MMYEGDRQKITALADTLAMDISFAEKSGSGVLNGFKKKVIPLLDMIVPVELKSVIWSSGLYFAGSTSGVAVRIGGNLNLMLLYNSTTKEVTVFVVDGSALPKEVLENGVFPDPWSRKKFLGTICPGVRKVFIRNALQDGGKWNMLGGQEIVSKYLEMRASGATSIEASAQVGLRGD